MRLYWIVIVFVFIGSIIAVYSVCSDTAGPVDSIVGMCQRISYGMLFAAGFWGMSYVLQQWMNRAAPLAVAGNAGRAPQSMPLAPPVPALGGSFETPATRYRVRGYDRDTKFETIEFIYADSPSNAQMKVELKGVAVASVEMAG